MGSALKIQIHRIGVQRTFGSSRLSLDELGIQRIGEPGDNFVLHIEKIGDGFVEPFGPEMVAGFSVYELHIDAQPVAATLYRALQDIADVQLGTELPYVDGLSFERECRIAGDDE